MGKQYLLFDLDGTLTDPKEGITRSVQYALRSFGIEVENLDDLIPFIGPPLRDSFMEFYGFTADQAGEGIRKYREYFNEKGWKENKVYPGIPQMLENLQAAGYELITATSKPEVFAVRIMKHFGLDGYFQMIGGADLDETRVKKADVIRYVMDRRGIGEKDHALMIGDRKHDVLGAREAGLECAAVLFGYGSREELESAKACYLAESVEDLERYLLERLEREGGGI